jgi:hypothetical protein
MESMSSGEAMRVTGLDLEGTGVIGSACRCSKLVSDSNDLFARHYEKSLYLFYQVALPKRIMTWKFRLLLPYFT